MHKGKKSAVMGVEPMEGGTPPPSYNLQEAEDAEFTEVASTPATKPKRGRTVAKPVKSKGTTPMSAKLEKLKTQLADVKAQAKEHNASLKELRTDVKAAKDELKEPARALKAAESVLARGIKKKDALADKVATLADKIAAEQ